MAKGNIDGYTLTDKMRKTRRRLPLTSTEQALYHELVAICNEDGWVDVFPCSNEELCTALRITENTLEKARLTLIGGGLVHYRSGKSKRQFGQYSFVKNITNSSTTSKFEVNNWVNAATNMGVNMGVNAEVNNGVNAADYNTETKTETKSKTKTSKSHSGGGPPVQKKIGNGTYWEKLVDVWFEFYAANFKNEEQQPAKPIFNAVEGAHLKKIAGHLKIIAKGKNKDWTEEYASRSLRYFFEKAYQHDKWLKENFELANMLSKFNSITNTTTASTTNGIDKKSNGKVLIGKERDYSGEI